MDFTCKDYKLNGSITTIYTIDLSNQSYQWGVIRAWIDNIRTAYNKKHNADIYKYNLSYERCEDLYEHYQPLMAKPNQSDISTREEFIQDLMDALNSEYNLDFETLIKEVFFD